MENKLPENLEQAKVIINQLSRGFAYVPVNDKYSFENQKINRIHKNQVTVKVHSNDILTVTDVNTMFELINDFLQVRFIDKWEIRFDMSNSEAKIFIVMDIGIEKNIEQKELDLK
jgi:hypothetical protein